MGFLNKLKTYFPILLGLLICIGGLIFLSNYFFPVLVHDLLMGIGLLGILGPYSQSLKMALLFFIVGIALIFSRSVIRFYKELFSVLNFTKQFEKDVIEKSLNSSFDPTDPTGIAKKEQLERLLQYERDKVRFLWQSRDRKLTLVIRISGLVLFLLMFVYFLEPFKKILEILAKILEILATQQGL